MKTEAQINERIEMLKRFADKMCAPADRNSIGSVAEAMARRQAFTTAFEELMWVLE